MRALVRILLVFVAVSLFVLPVASADLLDDVDDAIDRLGNRQMPRLPSPGDAVDCVLRETAIAPADPAEQLVIPSGQCSGIRPGAQVTVAGGCTMSWILFDDSNASDTVYYATIAGHCGNVGDGVFQGGRRIGVMVYSVDQPIGKDFGVFRIDSEDEGDIHAAMCGWGAPTGIYTTGSGPLGGPLVVQHFGFGIGFGSIEQARARAGVFTYENGEAFAFEGAASPGDSGSPAMLEGGLVLGVITDLSAVRTPGTGPLVPDDPTLATATVLGTLLESGLADFEADTGLQLKLLTGA